MAAKTIYVGLSGGVDSSLSAALLKQQGHRVVGVYMKNWTQDLPGLACPWQEDYRDAQRVAVQLGIELKVFDFEAEYKQRVVDYMLAEYQAGRTPNPDIMCNQEVKFKLFLNTALADGAEAIATGHYAATEAGKLYQAKDTNKDQTYFLYRVSQAALEKTYFPLGRLTKPEVRWQAQALGLVTAAKKDSVGICFVGKVGIREFLKQYVSPKPGPVINETGQVIGQHDGAIFYTIGQRQGLGIGGGLPYYVVGKHMPKNEVYVTTNLTDRRLWTNQLKLTDLHWINTPPAKHAPLQVRLRHRAPLVAAQLSRNYLTLAEEVRAATPGQSVVIYSGRQCLGGGVLV